MWSLLFWLRLKSVGQKLVVLSNPFDERPFAEAFVIHSCVVREPITEGRRKVQVDLILPLLSDLMTGTRFEHDAADRVHCHKAYRKSDSRVRQVVRAHNKTRKGDETSPAEADAEQQRLF